MFGIDFCDVKKWNPGISSSFLKDTHITCSYRRVYRIQPEDNHETKLKRKSFKKLHSFKHELKITFFFYWNFGEKRWGKQWYFNSATSREDIREAHTILAYCFTDSLCSLHVYTPQSTNNVLTQTGLLSFLCQFWLIFPNRNYRSRSIEYNFNRCWHHALHLKKKTLPIFENLVTTSRTTPKVVSCLKIPLASMCVIVRTSFPGSRPRQFFPTSPPPELFFQSIKETLLQPVLRRFITVFLQNNEGLENKLTRAPLLGLAKSIY